MLSSFQVSMLFHVAQVLRVQGLAARGWAQRDALAEQPPGRVELVHLKGL